MKPAVSLLLSTGALVGLAAAVAAQAPRPLVRRTVPPANPVRVPPRQPGQALPEGIKTARDPGARENFKPAGPNDPYVYLYGDTATYRDTADGGIATLNGHAHLLYKETRFESEKIVYNQKTQVGVAPGKLQIDDAQNTVVGDHGEADYGKRVARIQGGVTVTARPKPGGENAPEGSARREFKEPATITCSEVIYNWKTRVADTSKDTVIHCKIKERAWTITADKIQYRGKEETAILTGNVYGENDKKETVKGDALKVLLTEGKEAFDLTSLKQGTKFFVKEEKDEDEKPGDKTEPPPTKPDEKKTSNP